jgi:DNA (cytosine-5)-methyltransferase 1
VSAYYNEVNADAAQAIRDRIRAGLIAPGEVDERSIEDVLPADLAGFRQCHFFAGGGAWSYALRLAGWPDDRPVWTGSCPCQPFSAAGKRKGTADERHLWPAWFHLIEQCGPPVVFGEQVEGRDGLGWLDLVSSDMEAMGYACGATVAPAAGFGAPHIRHRQYWVAHAEHNGQRQYGISLGISSGGVEGAGYQRQRFWAHPTNGRATGELADAGGGGCEGGGVRHSASQAAILAPHGQPRRPGPTNGVWRDADWLGCRDAKWRPVEPGTFPLADGIPGRVGRLREHGNAIVAPQAAEFVAAVIDCLTAGAAA